MRISKPIARVSWTAGVLFVVVCAAVWLHPGRQGRTVPTEVPHKRLPVICIDPGHPSESNTGLTVQNGVTEREMNWEVAQKLEALLKKEPSVEVKQIREERDRYVRNSSRAKIANEEHASLVLHLHCDTGSGSGFTIYYPDRQGGAEGKVGPAQDVIESSHRAAKTVEREMAKTLRGSLRDRGVKGESRTYWGSRNGALTSSIFSEVPTITVEMVFLSNKHDARFIKSKTGQAKLAKALAKGALAFVRSDPHQAQTDAGP